MKRFELSALILCFLIGFASAQLTETKLLPGDGAAGDEFGSSISFNDSSVVVGAQDGVVNNFSRGSAYVFRNTGSGWVEFDKLIASDGGNGDQFGQAVGISGNYIMVGAEGHDLPASAVGAVYVFERTDTSWIQVAKLAASDAANGDRFGKSLSMEGDYAIIGAYNESENGNDAGAAYIFRNSPGGWVEETKLIASDGREGDRFGTSVFINGNYAIVGAPRNVNNTVESGAAYIFVNTPNGWVEETKIFPSDPTYDDRFGSSVTLNGSLAVVGAHQNIPSTSRNVGSAYIYRKGSSGWIGDGKVFLPDSVYNTYFGTAVALRGETVLVGATFVLANQVGAGGVFSFTSSEIGWRESGRIFPSDGALDDYFGTSVAVSADLTMIGAIGDDDNGGNSGSVYVYSEQAVGLEEPGRRHLNGFELKQNFPNPFNPETRIDYSVPNSGFVSIKIYDVLGRQLAILVDGLHGSGNFSVNWDAKTRDGNPLPGGVYYCRMVSAQFTQTRKMLLVR